MAQCTITNTYSKRRAKDGGPYVHRCRREARPEGNTCQQHYEWATRNRKLLIAKRRAGGQCYWCGVAISGGYYCAAHLEQKRFKRRGRKVRVMDAIGQHACQRCGITDIDLLTIDHMDGDGGEHRRRVGESHRMYSDIIRSPRRYRLQVLCWNCHARKDLIGDEDFLDDRRLLTSPVQMVGT